MSSEISPSLEYNSQSILTNGIIWGEAIMKKIGYLFLLTSLCLFTIVLAAEEKTAAKQSNVGLGFNLGFQKPYCDVLHTGAGLAGEFMARFYIGRYFDLSFGLGYGTLNDGFSYNTFQSNLINGDLKANIHLAKPGKFNPYLSLGAGILNYGYTATKPAQWYEKYGKKWQPDDNRYFDAAFITGGGMEIMTSPQTAINLLADYRFTSGDGLDGIVNSAKDGYLNTRIGFTYYLGKRQTKEEPTQDELLALQRAEYGTASGAEAAGSNEKLSMFEAKLDKLEASDTELSMEQYIRLKSRVDELNGMVEGKDKELDDLKSSLDFKNQRITDLETALQKTGTSTTVGSGGFSENYEEALRQFYGRDYRSAISRFSDLLKRFPQHNLASNCKYWIGESYFGLREYGAAADAFQAVYNYDNSTKKDDATIMLGRCYYNLNERDKAKSFFQALLDEYPDSEYSGKARQWLERL